MSPKTFNSFTDLFLANLGQSGFEDNKNFVCGDCKLFKTKHCPVKVEYKLAPICHFYIPDKSQKIYQKTNKSKILSVTIFLNERLKRKRRKKTTTKVSNKLYTEKGFINCDYRFGYLILDFLEKIVKVQKWKCQRKRCKDKKEFIVRVFNRRRNKVDKDTVYTVTSRKIDMILVCPGCNFIHGFPTTILKDVRDYIKEIKSKNLFENNKCETLEEKQKIISYIRNLLFHSCVGHKPIYTYIKGTLAYKHIQRKVNKIAKKLELEKKQIIGIIFHEAKSCIVLKEGKFKEVSLSEVNFLSFG